MKMKVVKNYKPNLADKDPILVSSSSSLDQTESSSSSKFNRSDKKKGIAVAGLVPELIGNFGTKRRDRSDIEGDKDRQQQSKKKKLDSGGSRATGATATEREEGGGQSRAAKKRQKLKAKQQTGSILTSDNNNSKQQIEHGEPLFRMPSESGVLTLAGKRKRAIDDADGESVSGRREGSSTEFEELDPGSFKSIVDILNLEDFKQVKDATAKARLLLGFIVQPLAVEDFYGSYWDKECVTSAKCSSSSGGGSSNLSKSSKKFSKLFSSRFFFDIIEQQLMSLGVDLSLVSCAVAKDAQSKPLRTEGQINAAELKSLFAYSNIGLQLLTPQKYDDLLWKLLSVLETEFGTAVSCNATLLPAYFECTRATYQLADMYILQVEGSSSYEVFRPETGKYPVDSVEEVNVLEEKLFLETTLLPGDFLYVPTGWIFTNSNPSKDQSLSLRLDVGEGNTMCGFLDMLLPRAMKEVFTASAEMRKSMPRMAHTYMGVAFSENDTSKKRKRFMATVKANLLKVVDSAISALDAAVDQHTKEFILARMPVPPDETEEGRSAHRAPNASIFPYTKLRVLRPSLARALIEDGKVVVYHCMDNGRERFAAPARPLEFDLDDGPAIEELLCAYPLGVSVEDLPHPSEELDDKLAVAQALYKEGLLVIEDEASRPSAGEGSESDDDPF